MTTENIPAQASDEPIEIPADLTEAEYWRRRAVASSTLLKIARAELEAMRAAPVIPAAGAVDDAKDAARYRFLRDSPTNTSPFALHGSVWVVRYDHMPGHLPSLETAGKGAALDRNVDAAISAQQGPEGKQ